VLCKGSPTFLPSSLKHGLVWCLARVVELPTPRPVVVPVMVHIPIVVVIFDSIGVSVTPRPAVILMSTVIISVAIAYTDISEINCDACARYDGSRNGHRWDRQTCC